MHRNRRRRDAFDYYDLREDDVYYEDQGNCYDCEHNRKSSCNNCRHLNCDHHHGTMEFTAVRGHNVDINSRPLGDQTMIMDRYDLYNRGLVQGYPDAYYQPNPYNPYNTQQLTLNPINSYPNQNPYNTQQLIFNPNSNNFDADENEKKRLKLEENLEFEKKQREEIESLMQIKNEEYEKQLEESRQMLDLVLSKQDEFNEVNIEKQREYDEKTAILERQIADLTSTLSKVTNSFGESISNLTRNLKNTQEILRHNNNQPTTLSVNKGILNDDGSTKIHHELKKENQVNSNMAINLNEPQSNFSFVNKIDDDINPVKIKKTKKETKQLKKETKQLKKEEKKLKKEAKKNKK